MEYVVCHEFKSRMKKVGLTTRDLANVLEEPPSTIGNRLNGFMTLSPEKREAIEEVLCMAEAQ